MRNLILVSSLALALSVVPAMAQQAQQPRQPAMVLTIPAFPDGTDVPVQFTQAAPGVENGGGTSPELKWENIPEGTKSLLVHFHDIDVARKNTTDDQLHWLVWNIPPTLSGLPEALPAGSPLADGSMQTSASGDFYRGPGAGANGPKHHYTFEVYALDTMLDVKPAEDPFETRKLVMDAVQGHVLGKAGYVGLFKRPS